MELTEATAERLLMVCAATPAEVDRACAEALRLLGDRGLADHAFAVHLLLREVLNNAVRHGCGSDPARRVECRFACEPDAIVIEVGDDGPGFAWREAMGGTCPVAGDACSGRGLCILKDYADEVRYSDGGNRVLLRRWIARRKDTR
jgi:serine/threonine-protein kinase RsbW